MGYIPFAVSMMEVKMKRRFVLLISILLVVTLACGGPPERVEGPSRHGTRAFLQTIPSIWRARSLADRPGTAGIRPSGDLPWQ